MSAEHVNTEGCWCNPKVVEHGGLRIPLHRGEFSSGSPIKRKAIAGLPAGWVIVGRREGSITMTQEDRDRQDRWINRPKGKGKR